MRIGKTLTYLLHDGGTKFYEAAIFSCHDTSRYVVVRRWGKISAKLGGGEMKIETFPTEMLAIRAHGKVMLSKRNGGYSSTGLSYGLKDGPDDFEHDMLDYALTKHYNDSKTAVAIINCLNLSGIPEVTPAPEVIDDVDELFMTEAKRKASRAAKAAEPEIVRSSDWASW